MSLLIILLNNLITWSPILQCPWIWTWASLLKAFLSIFIRSPPGQCGEVSILITAWCKVKQVFKPVFKIAAYPKGFKDGLKRPSFRSLSTAYKQLTIVRHRILIRFHCPWSCSDGVLSFFCFPKVPQVLLDIKYFTRVQSIHNIYNNL